MNPIHVIGAELEPAHQWLSTPPGGDPVSVTSSSTLEEATSRIAGSPPSLLIVHAARLVASPDSSWAEVINRQSTVCLVALTVTDEQHWAVLEKLRLAVAVPWPSQSNHFAAYVRRGLLVRDYRHQTTPYGTSTLGLYDALLNASADAVFVFSEQGDILQTNARAEWMFGLDGDGSQTCRITDLLALPAPFQIGHFQAVSVQRLLRQAPTLEGTNHEVVGRKTDGTTFPARVTFAAVRDTQPLVYVGVVGDISDQRSVEKRLLESEERYRFVVDAIPDGVLVHCNGKIVYINNAGAQLLGAESQDRLIGESVIPFIHPDHRPVVAERMRRVVELRETQPPLEEDIVRPDGTGVRLEVTSIPVTYNGIPSALVVARDRTAYHSQQALKLQAQKMDVMGTLASGIAHDFNNILGPILGYAELLKLNSDPMGQDIASIDAILTSARRARSLVKTILMFGRRTDGNRSWVHVPDIVAETLTLLRPGLNVAVTTQVMVPKDLPPVHADSTQLQQVLMNLCTNADSAMESVGGVLALSGNLVHVDSRRILQTQMQLQPGTYVCIEVSDTGCGIDPAILSRIFDPFFTTKEKGKGTGMGLAAVMGIVLSHNGAIDVHTEVGKGTTFLVYLPVAPEPVTPAVTPLPVRQIPLSQEILLVDDDPQILPLMASFARACGFLATVAQSAAEAIEKVAARPGRFAIVVTDQNMPDMLGTNLTRRLRKLDAGLKFVICSGINDTALAADALNCGVSARISKPFTLAEFKEVLDRVSTRASRD